MSSINKTARITVFLYLLMSALIFFGMYPPIHIVPGDVAATANNIMASESLFRFSIVSALLGHIGYIFVVLAFYKLLKPVNRNMAVLMVIFILVVVPIGMLNELNRIAVLQLLSGADYLKVFTSEQLHALVPVFLNLHRYGIVIIGFFWGLWLFPMGYLVFKSGFLPRILGVLLMIGCIGYLAQSLATFLFPNFNVSIVLITDWGEFFWALWLLIKGVNVEEWEKRARESA